MSSTTTRRRRLSGLAAAATAAMALSACGGGTAGGSASTSTSRTTSATTSTPTTSSTPDGSAPSAGGPASGTPSSGGTASGSTAPGTAGTASGSFSPSATSAAVPVTFAFGGDTQAYAAAEAIDTQGLGAVGRLMAGADIAMVNLETVVADSSAGLVPQPKQFHFVTDPRILTVLKDDGIDVVTSANNHGMDFGQEGLRRMLLVKDRHILPMLGIGHDADEAYTPFTTTVRGRNVVIFGASDVLDATLNWTATATKPGMAYLDTPGGLERLEAAVRQARSADPGAVVVVYLHWGSEKVRCPTARQREIANGLAAAGANVVVGSHAHIQQTTATIGSTAVAYGLGNFVFGSGSGLQARTGVLSVTVPATGTPTTSWTPAVIEGGLPHLLTGAARQRGIDEFNALDQGCTTH